MNKESKFISVAICSLCGNIPNFEINDNKYRAVCDCMVVGSDEGYNSKIEVIEAWNNVQEELKNGKDQFRRIKLCI